MKIRHRITIQFSIASSLILLGFGLSVFFFSSEYRKNEFFQRLKTRVDLAEKIFLERESFTEEEYEKIRQEFLYSLPDETEEVVKVNEEWQRNLKHPYPAEFLTLLVENGTSEFSRDTIQGSGRIFNLQDGQYAVLVTAVDKVGIRVLRNLRNIIIGALIGCVLVITLLSYFISQRLIKPISRKISNANSISVKNIHERLTVFNPNDELGELAIAFNNLLDRLDAAFSSQKLFVANASHEIRNPLTAIIGEAEVALEKDRSSAEYRESLRIIIQEADRLNMLVNNLLQLSNVSFSPTDIKRERISLNKLLSDSLRKYELLNPANQIRFDFDINPQKTGPHVFGNVNLLETALINIFDNASKFSHDAPVHVFISVGSNEVAISVKDQGIGIAQEDIPKITQPFFRADNVRQIRGTGIGIPLTLRIVELHQGKLEVQSKINKGTLVRITLPLHNES
ncbi:MAG: HAMP domain-containing histidine kinase [Cyclobacteriaceae bacterium]|nr:HAMP domain-containing histidine kinase [Cyclobacteriaceae bacterium]